MLTGTPEQAPMVPKKNLLCCGMLSRGWWLWARVPKGGLASVQGVDIQQITLAFQSSTTCTIRPALQGQAPALEACRSVPQEEFHEQGMRGCHKTLNRRSCMSRLVHGAMALWCTCGHTTLTLWRAGLELLAMSTGGNKGRWTGNGKELFQRMHRISARHDITVEHQNNIKHANLWCCRLFHRFTIPQKCKKSVVKIL